MSQSNSQYHSRCGTQRRSDPNQLQWQIMLTRLFRPAPLRTFSPISFHRYHKVSNVKFFSPARSFWISSRSRQQYRYVRFNDPFTNYSKQGRGPFQAWWDRMSPGQRILTIVFGGGAPIFYFTHLETVPESGRRRFIFLPPTMEEYLGEMVWSP